MRNGRSTATLALRVARSSTIAFAALGCTVGLAVTSAIPSAPTLLANALVMGGTFTPTPDQAEVDRDIADFINPTGAQIAERFRRFARVGCHKIVKCSEHLHYFRPAFALQFHCHH